MVLGDKKSLLDFPTIVTDIFPELEQPRIELFISNIKVKIEC